MVLCQSTDYVLLDEPLNNLDMRHSVQIMRRLRSMADDYGKTIVMVVHGINFAARYSDRIVAMRDGGVVAHGKVCDIMQPAVLRDVFDLDIKVHELAGRRIGDFYG